MTSRNRFGGLVVTVLVASLVLAAGRARAATIIHFEGEFSSGGLSGINTAISINQPGNDYAAGTGQEKIFYLSFGSVSSTLDPSSQWNTLPLNNLTINLSAFTVDNPFGSVTAFGIVLVFESATSIFSTRNSATTRVPRDTVPRVWTGRAGSG